MKKLINLILLAAACMTFACHKDAQLTTLAPVSFSGALTVTPNNVVSSPANDSLTVLTFNWPAVVYPVKAHVTYSLQVDLPADTVGATAWAKATSVPIGNDILTKTFKGSDLNALAIAVGINANDTGKLVIRVQAYQDRNTYSNAVAVSVKTYKLIVAFSHNYPVLYVPGDYQGWAPATAPTVAAEKTNIYEGYINEPAGGTYHFKFTTAQDWNHINYGDAGGGKLTSNGTAGDIVLPGPGYYEIVANTSTLTYSYTLVTWGILGDATPGGWNTDTKMSYDATKQVWSVTCAMVSTGSFKFRANNAWIIDFGLDANGRLFYADSPVFGNISGINNITVPSSGNYTITLDLHDPNNYNYTLHKN
jgi:hypothetical protein